MQTSSRKVFLQTFFFCTVFALAASGQPTVVSADPRGDYHSVKVVYSTVMDGVSATNAANYALVRTSDSAVVTITSATMDGTETNVVLHISGSLGVTTNYTLTISNVKDAGLNAITPNPTVVSFYFGGPPGGLSFTFDNGQVPNDTFLASAYPAGLDTFNGNNPTNVYQIITNVGGFNNSGCLTVVSNVTGQTFGQWHLTNVYNLAGNQPVTNFNVNFKFWMVNLDPGFSLAANTIGNGLVFHVGPEIPQQYTGGGSSWGNGLDLNFRNFANGIVPQGVNIWWYPPYTEPNTVAWMRNQDGAGQGFTIPSALPFPTGMQVYSTNWIHANSTVVNAYVDTNGIGGGTTGFSNYMNVDFSVSNGVANLTCSNANVGSVPLFVNQTIATWTPIIGGSPGSGLPASFDFTATDGAGNHQMVVIDDVDLTVNGVHIPGSGITTNVLGDVQFVMQPVSVTTNENVYVNFSASASGAPPYSWQWYSNSIPIPGANSPTYRTPLTLYSNTINGVVNYSVTVSNDFSYATSSNAVLTLIKDTSGVQVLSVGSVDGNSIGIQFSSFVDLVTAGNPANYQVNGGAVSVTAATVRSSFANYGDPVLNYPSYQKTVRLSLGSTVSSAYTVTIKSNVLSRTSVPVAETNLIGQVLGTSDLDLGSPGTDPLAAGEAFSAGTGQLEIISGGSDIMAIAPAGTTDHGHYAYVSRTGNFDMWARINWETLTASGAKAGLNVRPSPTDASSPALSETVFPPAPGRNTYETAYRDNFGNVCVGWGAGGVGANGNLASFWASAGGNWLRIRRLGSTFGAFASSDGQTWQLIGQSSPDTNTFGMTEYIGLIACAANNDGRLIEANSQNFGSTTISNAVVAITNNLPGSSTGFENQTKTLTIGASISGFNVPASELVFQWQRAEAAAPTTFNNILVGGNTNTYITPILTVAGDNGAKYRVICFAGDINTGHSVTSAVTTLNVFVDTTAPYMVSASADATFVQISINFDGPMDFSSTSDPSHYTLVPTAGGSPITINSATPTLNAGGTYTNVVLSLGSALSPGVKYTLTVANVLDAAQNNINNTAVPGGKQRIVTAWALAYGYLKYERYQGPLYPSGAGTFTGTLDGSPDGLLTSGTPIYNKFTAGTADFTQLITASGFPNGADFYNPATTSAGDVFDFGARISGYFIPPTNGNYQFYIRGNDGTALWVSGDSSIPDPLTSVPTVADNEGFGSGRSWIYSVTNIGVGSTVNGNFINSAPIVMTGGQLYGLAAFDQQANGGSCIEFTWGVGGSTSVFNGSNVTNSLNSTYRTFAGISTNTYLIKGTNIATYVNPDLSVITANGPTNVTVQQNRTATFSVSASAVVSAGGAGSSVPISYQWRKNGVDISGATSSSYTTPLAAYPGDNGATFAVVLSVSGLSFMMITNSATLTVIQDTFAPTVVSASSFGGKTIGIRYDALMDPATTTNTANYTSVSGGLAVTRAELRPDGLTVLLTLSGTLAGPTFSVTINNVRDLALNVIAPNTIASGNVLFPQMTAADIGVATNSSGLVLQTNSTLTNVTFNLSLPGSTVMAQDGMFEVVASGADIGNQQDGLHYIYEQRTGDFDVKVRVERIDGSSSRAKAGLLMREGLIPGNREYAIMVEPPATNVSDGTGAGFNGVEILRRTTNNLVTVAFANNPNAPVLGNAGAGTNMYPVWLRLRRTGNSVYVYTGADGTNWYLCGRETSTTASGQSAWAKAVYVGLATSARTNNFYTQSRFTQYGNFVAPARSQVLLVMGGNGAPATPQGHPAGNPNAPALWYSPDLYKYNLFLGLGYNILVVQDSTSALEDATGMSLVMWDGSVNSGNVGAKFRMVPVPVIVSKNNSLENAGKMGFVNNTADRNFAPSQTTIKIVHTNNPIVKGLYQTNQNVQVCSTPQYFSYAATNNPGVSGLGPAFTVVATSSTNTGWATIYYANPTATNAGGLWGNYPSNYVAHRRVGLWMGDNGIILPNSPGDWAASTSDGQNLLLNAINWAVATNEALTIITQPASQSVPFGSTATFSVGVSGPGPYTYQWYRNNNSLGGSAIYPDYTTAPVTGADNGSQFKVVVTGLYGSVTSSVATLTVTSTVVFSTPILNNGQLTISWSGGGILQTSLDVTGPWADVTGATSPYTNPTTLPRLFYRVRQ